MRRWDFSNHLSLSYFLTANLGQASTGLFWYSCYFPSHPFFLRRFEKNIQQRVVARISGTTLLRIRDEQGEKKYLTNYSNCRGKTTLFSQESLKFNRWHFSKVVKSAQFLCRSYTSQFLFKKWKVAYKDSGSENCRRGYLVVSIKAINGTQKQHAFWCELQHSMIFIHLKTLNLIFCLYFFGGG